MRVAGITQPLHSRSKGCWDIWQPAGTDALSTGTGEVESRREAALSVVLLVGTGLFVRSLRNVGALRLGLEPDRVLFARMGLRPAGASPAEADCPSV